MKMTWATTPAGWLYDQWAAGNVSFKTSSWHGTSDAPPGAPPAGLCQG